MGRLLSLALKLEEWLEGWDHWAIPRAVHAERRTMLVHGAPVRLYEDGCAVGAPLLLVHSLELFSSSFEMRRLFDLFRHERPCAAIDLPGFGVSLQEDAAHGPEILVAALGAAVRDLASRHGEGVDLVAAQGSAYLAWATAVEAGSRVRSLTLVCPTPTVSSLSRVFEVVPSFSRVPVYRMLGTRAGLRYHLGRAFCGDVDEPFLAYASRAARARGAWRPGSARLAGGLRSLVSVRRRPLEIPVHVVRGSGPLDPGWRATLERSSSWEETHLATLKGLLHYEFACSVGRAMRPFLRELDAAGTARRRAVSRSEVPRAR